MPHIHTHILRNHQLPDASSKLVLAIGNMDGVHAGHAALLKATRELADAKGLSAAVLTFDPHPRVYFNPQAGPLNLLPVSSKVALLHAHSMNRVIIAKFNKTLAEMPATSFITDLCVGQLGASHVVTGANFHFGKDRLGNAKLMADTMQQLGLGYHCVEPVNCGGGDVVSSTRIRNLLKLGDVAEASRLLGRPYSISGRVIHGDKRGGTIGFPTANIRVEHLFLPAYGVYAVEAKINDTWMRGVANLGIRPTFKRAAPVLEVHVLDANPSLYGKRLEVRLKHFIRAERKFDSTQSLIDQLTRDVIEARQYGIRD